MFDFGPPHTVRPDGGITCATVKHEQVRCEVVLLSVKQLLIQSRQFHICVNVNCFNFVFYPCPQLINDMDCKLFGACDYGSANINEECSLDSSNCLENEGNFALHLSLASRCVIVRYLRCYYSRYFSLDHLFSILQVVAHLTGLQTTKI